MSDSEPSSDDERGTATGVIDLGRPMQGIPGAPVWYAAPLAMSWLLHIEQPPELKKLHKFL